MCFVFQDVQANQCFQKSLGFKSFYSEFRISEKEGGHDRKEYSLFFCGILKKEYNFIALFLVILLIQRPCRKMQKRLSLVKH